MVNKTSFKNFSLVEHLIENEQPKTTVKPNVNHIFVVDVSGSMYGELPKIRTHLKNKLSSVMNDGDTISIIWFSGRNEAGVLKEEVEIKSLQDLSKFHELIDKWLKPIGLTAFDSPLRIAKEVIERISINRPNTLFSLVFATDGFNNNSNWSDVIKNLENLAPLLQASTFVEYGYYADSKAIQQMAEITGGEKVFAENFESFEPELESKLSNGNISSKKITIDLGYAPQYGIVWTDLDGQILIFNSVGGKVMVPSNIESLLFIARDLKGIEDSGIRSECKVADLLVSAYVLSDKMKTDEVDSLLCKVGSKSLLDEYTNAYGKQKLNLFRQKVKDIVNAPKSEWVDFVNSLEEGLEIKDDKFSLISLLNYLSDQPNIKFFPGHKSFIYNRIGAKRVDINTMVSQDELDSLKDTKSLTDIKQKMDDIASSKAEFVYDKTLGYSVQDFVYNEDRANISVRVKYNGVVKLPKNDFGLTEVDSFIYRNYTLIKDGLLNVQALPITCTDEQLSFFIENGVANEVDEVDRDGDKDIVILDLTSLPVVNRKQVSTISAKKLAELSWQLLSLQATNKALGYYNGLYNQKTSQNFANKYGVEAEQWLKSIGVTEYNGYNPETVKSDTISDTYVALSLEVKIAKCSSLPKVEDVINSVKSGKSLKITESLMKPVIESYDKEINSEVLSKFDDKKKAEVIGQWLDIYKRETNDKKKELMNEISEIKFAQILSRKWFPEFPEIENSKLLMNLDGNDLEFKFELNEKEISI